MSYDILETVNSPADVKALDNKKIEPLCAEIRDFLVEKVSVSGGHLASNLGVVELSVALHRFLTARPTISSLTSDIRHMCISF